MAAVAVLAVTAISCTDHIEDPRLDPGVWTPMKSPTEENLRGVFGFDSGEVFAVGDNGTIVHYDGRSWLTMESGTTANLVGVWGKAPDKVVVTGDAGTILLYDGVAWTAMESGTTEPIGPVWGWPLSYGPPSADSFLAWAVGGGPAGTVLYFDGNDWQAVDTGGSEPLLNIAGWVSHWANNAGPYLMAVGANGSVRLYDGANWAGTDPGVEQDLVGVFGELIDNVYAIARDGSIIQNTTRFVGSGAAEWHEAGAITGGRLAAIAGRTYNDIFVVGGDGRIVNFDRLNLTDMRSPSDASLNAVWSGEHRVYAVGDRGTILRYSRRPAVEACPVNVRMSVSEERTPTITWWPRCPVSRVAVESKWDPGGWSIEADGNLIYPGVEFGSAPEAAIESRPVSPLQDGALYRVTLYRRTWDKELMIGSWNVRPDDAPAPAAGGGSDTEDDAPIFHFTGLSLTGTGANIYTFDETVEVYDGDWRIHGDPVTRESALSIRSVIVESLERDPDTNEIMIVIYNNIRAADLRGISGGTKTVVWDIIEE